MLEIINFFAHFAQEKGGWPISPAPYERGLAKFLSISI